MRISHFQTQSAPGLCLAQPDGHWSCIPGSSIATLERRGASCCTQQRCTAAPPQFGDPWKCTTPPCLPGFLPKKRANGERRTHRPLPNRSHWAPSQRYTAATSTTKHKTCFRADKP